jgi:hypothetical protein
LAAITWGIVINEKRKVKRN